MRVSALAALGLLVGCASTPEPAPYLAAPLEQRVTSLVISAIGQGSAFPITPTAFLTAKHVVAFNDEVLKPQLVTVDGAFVAEVIPLDGIDAAVLVMTEPHGRTPWRLDVRQCAIGEDVVASGFGLGDHWFSRGTGQSDPERIALHIMPGDSGGALLDSQGDVLGILVAARMHSHHSYIVPMTQVWPLLPGRIRAYTELA